MFIIQRSSLVQVLCDDTFRQFDDLLLRLSKVEEQIVGDVIRLIVVKEPLAVTTNINMECGTLAYLLEVLPVAVQFMEKHPTIGSLKGERSIG